MRWGGWSNRSARPRYVGDGYCVGAGQGQQQAQQPAGGGELAERQRRGIMVSSFKVSGRPAAISVTRSAGCPPPRWFERAQRVHEGAHFAPQGDHAQANLVAHQHHGAGRVRQRFEKVSCLRLPIRPRGLYLLYIGGSAGISRLVSHRVRQSTTIRVSGVLCAARAPGQVAAALPPVQSRARARRGRPGGERCAARISSSHGWPVATSTARCAGAVQPWRPAVRRGATCRCLATQDEFTAGNGQRRGTCLGKNSEWVGWWPRLRTRGLRSRPVGLMKECSNNRLGATGLDTMHESSSRRSGAGWYTTSSASITCMVPGAGRYAHSTGAGCSVLSNERCGRARYLRAHASARGPSRPSAAAW